ncbi:hypothetical protein [uncultured Campylobacter sp.]|uniref:hypothetical protein n=1 Tax=uncultured Campylobacter sp. TaxID=218934 RepID=UPI00262CD951|nr:hypothetical protein [uncultured Campylobacter sp.]
MTFSNFKERLQIATRPDVLAPSDEEIKTLMGEAALEICKAITPLEMIEIDHRSFEVAYHLEGDYFVRKFKLPAKDSDEIDFKDDSLISALLYGIAAKHGRDDFFQKYRSFYQRSLCEYELNNFDENTPDLTAALVRSGYLKPYSVNYAMSSTYRFVPEFLEKLDFWLADIARARNLSWRNFIYDFIKYQNKQIDRADLAALDKIMKEKVKP